MAGGRCRLETAVGGENDSSRGRRTRMRQEIEGAKGLGQGEAGRSVGIGGCARGIW